MKTLTQILAEHNIRELQPDPLLIRLARMPFNTKKPRPSTFVKLHKRRADNKIKRGSK